MSSNLSNTLSRSKTINTLRISNMPSLNKIISTHRITITNELVSKLGMKVLSKGVTVEITDKTAVVYISVILKYGYSIPEVSEKIQERVASAIETMTGLTVAEVNIKIAGVKVENNK